MMTSRPPTAVTTCLRLHARGGERALDRFGDDAGIHDFALDDGVGEQRHDRGLDELRLLLGVIDDRDLDQSGADVEADRGFLATEQCHECRCGPGKRGGRSPNAHAAPREGRVRAG